MSPNDGPEAPVASALFAIPELRPASGRELLHAFIVGCRVERGLVNAAIVQGSRPKTTTVKLTYRKADYPPRRALNIRPAFDRPLEHHLITAWRVLAAVA